MNNLNLRHIMKNLNTTLAILLTIVMLVTGLFTYSVEAKANITAESIKINKTIVTLKEGKKLTLKATVSPKNAVANNIAWKTNNSDVATVNNKGVVIAKKNGKATITARIKGTNIKSKCTIIVGVPVNKISVENKNITLKKGETSQVAVIITPKKATTKAVTYSTSDKNIVTVNKKGKITAKAVGKATITVKSTDGTGKKAKVKVIVKEVTETEIPNEIEETTNEISDNGSTNDNSFYGGTQTINVTGVSLNLTEKEIKINETITLNETVTPSSATNKSVKWSSSNSDIAEVDTNGNVTGKASGNAVITVTTNSGNKSATCNITVQNSITALSHEELITALNEEPDFLIYSTDIGGTVTIPNGIYNDTTLIIKTPNLTIENNAVFKEIIIEQIASETWLEKSTGNTIDIIAKDAHVVVASGSAVTIMVNEGSENLKLDNDGVINNIILNTNTEISISGTSSNTIPVQSNAHGTRIITSIPLDIIAEQQIDLELHRGAENTSITVSNENAIPTISGVGIVGTIDVNIGDNETITIIPDNISSIDENDEAIEKGIIKGRIVTSEDTNIIVSGAAIYLVPYRSSIDGSESSLELAITAAEAQEKCYVVQSDFNGEYITPEIPYGNYALIVKADGRSSYLQTIILSRSEIQNQTIQMFAYTEELGNIQGEIRNAADGQAVEAGIKLILRRNASNISGSIIATTFTDDAGKYSFNDLGAGIYTIQVVDERIDISDENRYVRTSFNVPIVGGVTMEENHTVTKSIGDDQIRFVLSWEKQTEELDEFDDPVARDLDSHLVGPAGNASSKFHVYYSNTSYYREGIEYADLDVDDTDWEGPETTTIYQKENGIYHFYIFDYSNQNDSDNMKLTNSQAVVKVYAGNREIANYNVPYGAGTLWDVCTYNSETGELTGINQIYYFEGDSDDIGIDMLEKAIDNLDETIVAANKVLPNLDETIRSEFQEKIDNATNYLNSINIDDIRTVYGQLREEIDTILDSTEIYDISSENGYIYWDMTRYTNSDYDYSVLYIESYYGDTISDLEFEFTDYVECVISSDFDVEYYDGKFTVYNEITKVSETYYVVIYDYSDDMEYYGISPINFNIDYNYTTKK